MELNNSAFKASLDQNVTASRKQVTHVEFLTFVTHYKHRTVSHQTFCTRTVENTKRFSRRRATADVTNPQNETQLQTCLYYKPDVKTLKELLHQEADGNGDTPLHLLAICGRNVQWVQQLLELGADANVTNAMDLSPLNLAVLFKADVAIVEHMLRYRANSLTADVMGITPFYRAMYDVQLAKLLVKYTLVNTSVDDPSSLLNLNAYTRLANYATVNCYLAECVSELVRMKTIKINKRSSLYDLVTVTNSSIPLYLENESTKILTREEKVIASYPVYSDVIIPKVKYALQRGILLKKLDGECIYSRNDCEQIQSKEEKVMLNYSCSSAVVAYLSNNDISNLMLAYHNPHMSTSESYVPITGLEKGD